MTITLATLDQATSQQVFDQVSNHLLTQMKRSTNPFSSLCAYRSGTLKCAAGCLIADSEYLPEMEQNSWIALRHDLDITMSHESLISYLQRIHDSCKPVQWAIELRKLASALDLQCNFNLGV